MKNLQRSSLTEKDKNKSPVTFLGDIRKTEFLLTMPICLFTLPLICFGIFC